jgi:hypothetical protein
MEKNKKRTIIKISSVHEIGPILNERKSMTEKQHARLSGEHIEMTHSDCNEIWPVDTPRCPHNNPTRIWVSITPLHSYSQILPWYPEEANIHIQ